MDIAVTACVYRGLYVHVVLWCVCARQQLACRAAVKTGALCRIMPGGAARLQVPICQQAFRTYPLCLGTCCHVSFSATCANSLYAPVLLLLAAPRAAACAGVACVSARGVRTTCLLSTRS
jgi:hypothetical protein